MTIGLVETGSMCAWRDASREWPSGAVVESWLGGGCRLTLIAAASSSSCSIRWYRKGPVDESLSDRIGV